eukprot:8535709-Pyramimonas_sp.AAC.1
MPLRVMVFFAADIRNVRRLRMGKRATIHVHRRRASIKTAEKRACGPSITRVWFVGMRPFGWLVGGLV